MSKKNPKLEVTKTTVECYKLRFEGGLWADITIDDNSVGDKGAGRIQIASDFGNWSNYWGACGSPFKKFLESLDIHYTAGKFGADKWFDFAATIKELKRNINEDAYGDERKSLLAELKEIEENCTEDIMDFRIQIENSTELLQFVSHSPDVITGVHPSFKRFWDEIWQEFRYILHKELL